MNVYSKLAKARVELQNKPLKKSGKNKHLNFNYYELDDFLPTINTINESIGLLPVFSIGLNGATLTVYDTDGDTFITFTSPVAHAKLQGNASDIQELGSQHTYMRRYMYLLAYEITENDTLDPSIGQTPTPTPTAPKSTKEPAKMAPKAPTLITPQQAADFVAKATEHDKPVQPILDYLKLAKLEDMTIEQYNAILAKWSK